MNKPLLEYEIKSKGFKTNEIIKKLGISKSAWYRKINGHSEFTQSEIQNLIDILDLKNVKSIFFNDLVS